MTAPNRKKKRTTKAQPRFPTKAEFIEWWDEKKDAIHVGGSRPKTCPLARYLHDVAGFPHPRVFDTNWYRDWERDGAWGYDDSIALPDWAIDFVRASDKMPKPYRGLPDGFR